MKEIFDDLYVGSQGDYERKVKGEEGWAVIQAAQSPYHRQALGYSSQGAPKKHPEYKVARRGNRLILNMVDSPNPKYFSRELIEPALDFIDEQLSQENKVLIHCNEGKSRAPSLGLLYLATRTDIIPDSSLREAEQKFKGRYPAYNPKPGIRGHLKENWDHYKKNATK